MHNDAHCNALLPNGGLYAISDGPRADLLAACEAVLRGGATLLQYRDKSTNQVHRRAEAAALVTLCAGFNVPLIINDDIELAASVGAAGVHLGERDATVASARTRLGAGAIVGVSCYNAIERARQAVAEGADYLAFGTFYPSPTKPNALRASPGLLRTARPLGLPLVAIGGITADNAQPLLDAGAHFLAVVSGVFSVDDPAAAARRYAALFQK
jgi:thiamine-phosphate pyrophosphorylase